MLTTLDMLNIITQDNDMKPLIWIDEHKSQLEVPSLELINTPSDHWVVYLEIPYDISLLQVVDSKEQNRSSNIAIVKAKHDLLDFKIKGFQRKFA